MISPDYASSGPGSSSDNFPATTGARAGRTAIAMLIQDNLPSGQFFEIKIPNVTGRARFNLEFQHLIEITVIEAAFPTHRNHISAHEAGKGCRVEGMDQGLHVLLVLPLGLQVV